MTKDFAVPGRLWRWLLWALILHSAGYIGVYAYHAAAGAPYGGDYRALWGAAHALANGASAREIYDTSGLAQLLADRRVEDTGKLAAFPYPPTFLGFILPFGYMGYAGSLLAWLLVTGLLYVLAVFRSEEWRNLVASDTNKKLLAAFVIASPFALYNAVTGQTGFLMAALLIAGLNMLRRSPVLAGIAFGLLSMKPQLGIMVPVLLLAERRWRCLGAAMATAIVLALATNFWLGSESWGYYRDYIQMFARTVAHVPETVMSLNASLYRVLAVAGVGDSMAFSIQAAFAALGAWSVWMACRRNAPVELRNALLVTGTFIAAPYIMIYDMTICILPVLFLLKEIAQGRERDGEWLALVLLLVAPMIALSMPGIPVVFLSVLFVHTLLLKRANQFLSSRLWGDKGYTPNRRD